MPAQQTKLIRTVRRGCPICGGTRAECLLRQEFCLYQGHCLPDSYDLVSCAQCGFVYADTRATQKEYNQYYNLFSKYESAQGPCGINPHEAHKYERIIKDLDDILPGKEASVLDIGCAKGGLLITMQQHGYQHLTGLDPSPNCVQQVRQQGIRAIQGGLFAENFGTEQLEDRYDCVILSHILEHVVDLQTAVRRTVPLVKPGGFLYIEVPDAARYTRYYVAPYSYFELEHINHFDRQALDNLMSEYAGDLTAAGDKDVRHSTLICYPAVYVIYRLQNRDGASRRIVPGSVARENVRRYIEMSRQGMYWPELEDLAAGQEEIVVWGAGAYAMRLYRTTRLKDCRINSFVDNDPKKHGARFDSGVVIRSPREVLSDFSGPIVVCSAVYNHEIVEEIQALGLENRLIVLR